MGKEILMSRFSSSSSILRRQAPADLGALVAVFCLLLLGAGAAQAQPPFVRTVIVNSGSSPTVNGANLVASLASITTNSSTNPWLVKVEPGIFDLGTSSLAMKDYVDIEGSGPLVTTITSAQPRGVSNLATININSGVHAELRQLTVQNTSTDAIAITYTNSNPALDHLNIVVPNGQVSTFGILGQGGNPTITNVTMQLTSANNTSEGLYFSGSPVVRDVTIGIQNTSAVVASTGIVSTGGSAQIDRAVVNVSGAVSNYGAQLNNSTPSVTHSQFTVNTTGTGAAEGIRCFGSTCTLDEATIAVTGGGFSYGIVLDGGSAPSTVRHSVINVSGASLQANGVYVDDLTTAVLRFLDVKASGTAQVIGLNADYANGGGTGESLTVSDSAFQATGGTSNLGINVTGTGNAFAIARTSAVATTATSYGIADASFGNSYTFDHSQLSGGTGSVNLVNTFSAGASQLSGPVTLSGTCVDSYNGAYTALSATCH